MRRWWKRLVGATVLLLGSALPAAAAITWLVASDTDCTGFAAATGLSSTASVPCCKATAAGGGNACNKIEYLGDMKVRQVTFVVGAAGTYTTGGDALNAAAITRIGMTGGVYFANCQGTSAGQDVNWIPTAPTATATWGAKLQLFQSGTLGSTTIIAGGEFGSGATLTNVSIACMVFGY